jgi:hypothetical protein
MPTSSGTGEREFSPLDLVPEGRISIYQELDVVFFGFRFIKDSAEEIQLQKS